MKHLNSVSLVEQTSDQILLSTFSSTNLDDDMSSEKMCHSGEPVSARHRFYTARSTGTHLPSLRSLGNTTTTGLQYARSLIWSKCSNASSLESHLSTSLPSHWHLSSCNPFSTDTAACQKTVQPKDSILRRSSGRPRRFSRGCHRLLALAIITFLALTTLLDSADCSPNDAWRHRHPSSTPSKIKSQRNFGMSAASAASQLGSYSVAKYGPASASHRRSPSSSSVNLANYNAYLNSQLIPVPFSANQQLLYQHQMLPHHSAYPHAPSPTISTGTAMGHHSASRGGRSKMANIESNHVNAQLPSSNPINRAKGKWWDIARQGHSGSLLRDQMTYSEGHHANDILSSSSLSTNIAIPLRKKQRRLANNNPGLIQSVTKAMRIAIRECQNQLKDHRWNCPVNEWKKGKNVFGKIIQTGCRETAFVYALTSAAVAHTIARDCSQGLISTCSCDRTTYSMKSGPDWQWGGCSDNIKSGYKFARSFVDASEKGRDQRFVMNLHNNEAGRLHVSNEMRRECKCHGMSGSCTIKTCWMRVATFREIGNSLKDRFDRASRVRVSNDFRGIARNKQKLKKKSVQLETYEKGYPSPTNSDLIFFEESPDFCVANPKYGIQGTSGRECNASSISVDSCNLVCCDRGFTTEEVEVTERCNCTFRWCCEVQCSACKVKKKIHKCN